MVRRPGFASPRTRSWSSRCVFPGGSIGELAVNGTVNDLAVAGARPLAISLALVLEEGLDAERPARPRSRRSPSAATAAGVEVVTGDTKVVERGLADGMYVCTSGVGRRDPRAALATGSLAPGRPGPGLAHDRRARDRDHARPRRARARGRRRLRHPPAVAGRRRAARRRRSGAADDARRDPRRGRHRAQRARPRLRRSGSPSTRPRSRSPPRWRAPPNCLESTRCTSPTRG